VAIVTHVRGDMEKVCKVGEEMERKERKGKGRGGEGTEGTNIKRSSKMTQDINATNPY